MATKGSPVVDLKAIIQNRNSSSKKIQSLKTRLQRSSRMSVKKDSEKPSPRLSTDPLRTFSLDIGEYRSIASPSPISFVPQTQKGSNPNIWSPRQKKLSISRVTMPRMNLRFPRIHPPTVPVLSQSLRVTFGIFMISVIATTSLVPGLLLVNRGLRIKDNLILQANASEQLIRTGSEADQIEVLARDLTTVSEGFAKTSNDLAGLTGSLDKLIRLFPGISLLSDSQDLTESVSNLTALGSELSLALAPFLNKQIDPFNPQAEASLVDSVKEVQRITRLLTVELHDLEDNLGRLDTWVLPGDTKEQVKKLKTTLPLVITSLEQSDTYFDLFLTFVGYDYGRRYLFVFQNNQELRATGGFIGSFGLMDIDRGVVESLSIKEIYNPDGQLTKQILAPSPLHELTPRWFLRDSNWFADFPTSARRMMWFYEKTGGPTPDGVISLTPTMIERLLRITGPIAMPQYGVEVTADNFIRTTQYQTVTEYAVDASKPKQFIDDLAPILIARILSAKPDQYGEIVDALQASFKEKHVLLYFLNDDLQKVVEQFNLSGALYKTSKDYLSVVHTNIGGFKSDGVIEDSVDVRTRIEPSGRVINTVQVKRNHKGGNTEYAWWNVPNINYMRLYVPEGSKILRVEGFDVKEPTKLSENTAGFEQDPIIQEWEGSRKSHTDWNLDEFQESGKTVFGGWKTTQPQQESEIILEYELPFRLAKRDIYSMIIQKQSGSIGGRFGYTVEFPQESRVTWVESSGEVKRDQNGITLAEGILRTDQYLGIILE